MHVIRPIVFKPEQLISSNAVESVADWNAGTTYNTGQQATYANNVYECATNGVINVPPTSDPTKWLKVRTINKYLAFDDKVGTATTANGELIMVIQPGQVIDSLAMFNIIGSSIEVEMKDYQGNVVYEKVIPMDDTLIIDWFDYFTKPFDFRRNVILADFPQYSSPTITIKVKPNESSNTTGIGQMTYGNKYLIGKTQFGASSGIKDYSVKETDKYGNTFLQPGSYNDRMEVEIWVEPFNTKFVKNILTDLRATPAVWFATEISEYENLNVYGYYRDFNVVVSGPSYSICTLEIEGL